MSKEAPSESKLSTINSENNYKFRQPTIKESKIHQTTRNVVSKKTSDTIKNRQKKMMKKSKLNHNLSNHYAPVKLGKRLSEATTTYGENQNSGPFGARFNSNLEIGSVGVGQHGVKMRRTSVQSSIGVGGSNKLSFSLARVQNSLGSISEASSNDGPLRLRTEDLKPKKHNIPSTKKTNKGKISNTAVTRFQASQLSLNSRIQPPSVTDAIKSNRMKKKKKTNKKKEISLWHDVTLVHVDDTTGKPTPYLNFVNEIPKFSR